MIQDVCIVDVSLKHNSGDILSNGKLYKNDKVTELLKDKSVSLMRTDASLHESEYTDAYDRIIGRIVGFDKHDRYITCKMMLVNTLEFYKMQHPILYIIGECIETYTTIELSKVYRVEIGEDNTKQGG